MINSYKILDRNLKGRDYGMDIRTTVSEVADWIYLAQNRDQMWALVNTVMNLRVL
jgi:hypothetical protein